MSARELLEQLSASFIIIRKCFLFIFLWHKDIEVCVWESQMSWCVWAPFLERNLCASVCWYSRWRPLTHITHTQGCWEETMQRCPEALLKRFSVHLASDHILLMCLEKNLPQTHTNAWIPQTALVFKSAACCIYCRVENEGNLGHWPHTHTRCLSFFIFNTLYLPWSFQQIPNSPSHRLYIFKHVYQ